MSFKKAIEGTKSTTNVSPTTHLSSLTSPKYYLTICLTPFQKLALYKKYVSSSLT